MLFWGLSGRKNRVKSGKKPGGQSGHKGNFLKMRNHNDETIHHIPNTCQQCGYVLQSVEEKELNRGQVIDIPVVRTKVTQHINYAKQCPCCNTVNKSNLPGTLDYCNVQYGQNIKDFIVFLSARQYISIARIKEVIHAMTGESVSTGFISNCIAQKSETLRQTYDQILEKIKTGNCVHGDETGMKIKDKKNWIWVWLCENWVYFKSSAKRSYETIVEALGEIQNNFILVSDRWAAQLKTKCKDHQLCLVHLIRDCNKLIENYQSKWAIKLKILFEQILSQKHQNKKIGQAQIKKIENKLNQLLHQKLLNSHEKVITFRDQLKKLKSYITTCLKHVNVPAHNNAAERSIRNVKLKMKISTNFRSTTGAENYAIIRSIIDTAIAKNISVFDALKNPCVKHWYKQSSV